MSTQNTPHHSTPPCASRSPHSALLPHLAQAAPRAQHFCHILTKSTAQHSALRTQHFCHILTESTTIARAFGSAGHVAAHSSCAVANSRIAAATPAHASASRHQKERTKRQKGERGRGTHCCSSRTTASRPRRPGTTRSCPPPRRPSQNKTACQTAPRARRYPRCSACSPVPRCRCPSPRPRPSTGPASRSSGSRSARTAENPRARRTSRRTRARACGAAASRRRSG